jgi:chemotaxis protein CheC
VLREIGNIGAGNAATSLGVLLNEDVHISVPEVRIEDFGDVVKSLGGPEEMCVAVLVKFFGEASGLVLFLLSVEDAKGIMDILVGEDESDLPGLSEMKMSVVKELGNILGSAYIGSIATLTNLSISLSVPHLAIDMLGAILAAPIVEYGAHDSKVMFIEESFSTNARNLSSHVIMFSDIETLRGIMNKLGLELCAIRSLSGFLNRVFLNRRTRL